MWMVTGGNGQLGRAIVDHLVTLVDPSTVAVGVRDPQIATGLGRLGVEVRRADFEDAAAMRTAFDGVERMVLVSTNAMPHTSRYRHLQDATDAALRAGVDSIVYTSLITTAPESIGDVHRLSELTCAVAVPGSRSCDTPSTWRTSSTNWSQKRASSP